MLTTNPSCAALSLVRQTPRDVIEALLEHDLLLLILLRGVADPLMRFFEDCLVILSSRLCRVLGEFFNEVPLDHIARQAQ